MPVRVDPRDLVDRHESMLRPGHRRALGVHYTPVGLARRLVGLALDEHGGIPTAVLDPSCGAGSILLAAADELLARGLGAEEVPRRLHGTDLDPDAVAVARRALDQWCALHGVEGAEGPHLVVRDALCGARIPSVVEVVVGNPPFSSPLFGQSIGIADPLRESPGGPYTDASAQHLLAAVRSAQAGTVVCMLQPQSVLSARDAAGIRRDLVERADLRAMWLSDEQPFDAAVQVCAPVLCTRGAPWGPAAHGSGVRVHWRDEPAIRCDIDTAASWSPLLAAVLGVPRVTIDDAANHARLADVANCTAGFRDEFYALTAVAHEQCEPAPEQRCPVAGTGVARLVTSGMIDPSRIAWGERPWRLAGRRMMSPVVDLGELDAHSRRVARWARARLLPKVLVASQTRVLEPAIDTTGECLPLTPVVSVEPIRSVPRVPLEAIAGALAAPSSSATIATASAGSGLSSGSLRISASALGTLRIPRQEGALARLAAAWVELDHAMSPGGDLLTVGAALDAAMGVADAGILHWWAERAARRRSST